MAATEAHSTETLTSPSTRPRSAKAVVEDLPDDVVQLMAALDHVNADIARGVVSGLPFGTRSWLAAAGVLEAPKDRGVLWNITKHGRDVISACAGAETTRDQKWLRELEADGHLFNALPDAELPRPA